MAKANPILPFRVYFGVEDFFHDRDISRAKRWVNRSVTVLDGEEGLTDGAVVAACEASGIDITSFDGTDTGTVLRAVIVDNAQKVKGDKALKAYIGAKDRLDASVVLVAFIRGEKLPDAWQVGEKGLIVEHKKLTTWEGNNQVVKWIKREAKEIHLDISDDLCEMLYVNVSSDLYRLASELQKLVLLLGAGGKVTLADLRLITTTSLAAEPWQVAEAAVAKDPKKAMNLVSTVYKSMGDDASVPVVSALMKQIEKLIIARQMLDRGASEEEIAAGVDMSKGRLFHFLPLVRKHDFQTLVGHMSRLCRLDINVKGAASSKRTLVELAVLAIAGEGVGA